MNKYINKNFVYSIFYLSIYIYIYKSILYIFFILKINLIIINNKKRF